MHFNDGLTDDDDLKGHLLRAEPIDTCKIEMKDKKIFYLNVQNSGTRIVAIIKQYRHLTVRNKTLRNIQNSGTTRLTHRQRVSSLNGIQLDPQVMLFKDFCSSKETKLLANRNTGVFN